MNRHKKLNKLQTRKYEGQPHWNALWSNRENPKAQELAVAKEK
jgi:hypothetical protein